MIFGYARVSSRQQNEGRQVKELTGYGVAEENIFIDKISGIEADRPALNDLLSRLREGDTLVVCSFDRLARSTTQLLSLAERLGNGKVELKSLKENIDTSTPYGKMFFTISSAFAQFEREIIRERQAEGLALAKSKGVKLGRPRMAEDKVERAVELYKQTDLSVSVICEMCGLSRPVLYRRLKEQGISRRTLVQENTFDK